MNKLQERDVPRLIRPTKNAELILQFNKLDNDYLVSIKLSHNVDPVYIYTQRGSIKSFKSIQRAIAWGEAYSFSKAIVIHSYDKE